MAYIVAERWSPDEIVITFVDEASEGDIVTIRVAAGANVLLIMGEIVEEGKRLTANGVHVSSQGVHPNEVGIVNLREIARKVMEIGGYDEIVAKGAVRTTGAHPGHRPRQVRFLRGGGAALARKPQ